MSLKTGKDVRPHHYQFAHRALPAMMFGSVDENLGYLVDQPQRFIEHVWGFVGKKLGERGEPVLTTPPPRVQRVAMNPGVMWVIELLTPEAMAEARLVGIVPLRPDGPPGERLAYFTQEYSFDLKTLEPYDVLCRWTAEGSHHNLGLKVQPTVAAFVATVGQVLRGPATG